MGGQVETSLTGPRRGERSKTTWHGPVFHARDAPGWWRVKHIDRGRCLSYRAKMLERQGLGQVTLYPIAGERDSVRSCLLDGLSFIAAARSLGSQPGLSPHR